MTGLRQKQKADRDRRILEAAASLFREVGYEAAKIEAIAGQAEVSIGTIYNYYQNTGDLLVAIVSMEVNEVLAAGEVVVARPPAEPARAIDRLFAIYLEHSQVYLSKAMWRHAMAISTQQPESRFGRAYSELDRRLADQIRRLIARLQAMGAARADVDARTLGELVFNNMNMMFINFVKAEEMPVRLLLAEIRRQNRPVLEAIRVSARAIAPALPRNRERVRVRAVGG
jgi:AcrR family transcriptional regulator